ncbi:MAG: hypothetical protein RR229_05465 [Oscillospiraceae bacterium]
MIDSTHFIKELVLEKAKEDRAFSVYPNIPDKKLVNAANKIANGVDPYTIIAVYDTTAFESCKEGIAFTGTNMYLRDILSSTITVPLTDITNAVFSSETKTDENGKQHTIQKIVISYNNRSDITITSNDFNHQLEFIAEVLNGIAESIDSIKDVCQIAKLEELGEEITEIYVSIISNYLMADDGIIDSSEYKELISLMARIKVSKDSAERLRRKRLSEDNSCNDFAILIKELDDSISEKNVDYTGINQSLFFDLLLVKKEKMDDWKNDKVLRELQQLLNVSDGQANIGINKIRLDERIVSERLEDKQIKDFTKELIAVAGGAGVTLAALAITGGVSTGVWGGLLTLGLLPTGGMIFGLAAIGGVGYGAYKGIKYFSGTSEYEKSGIRIAALQGAIEMNKAATTYMIDDINYITRSMCEISKKIAKNNENDKLLQELLSDIELTETIGSSARSLDNDNEKNNYEIYLSNSHIVVLVN